MNKKVNTLLFILGATLFNIIITIIFFLILLRLYVKLIMPLIPEDGRTWGFPIIFIAAIALSFVAYRVALKQLIKKINIDKYFDPLFRGRKR
jgi:uncharacterized membrane protein (DUF441 family)